MFLVPVPRMDEGLFDSCASCFSRLPGIRWLELRRKIILYPWDIFEGPGGKLAIPSDWVFFRLLDPMYLANGTGGRVGDSSGVAGIEKYVVDEASEEEGWDQPEPSDEYHTWNEEINQPVQGDVVERRSVGVARVMTSIRPDRRMDCVLRRNGLSGSMGRLNNSPGTNSDNHQYWVVRGT